MNSTGPYRAIILPSKPLDAKNTSLFIYHYKKSTTKNHKAWSKTITGFT